MNGIKEITTYKKNELGQTVKTVQKVKVSKKTVRVSRTVLARRQWPKFGEAKGKPAGYHGSGFTDTGETNVDVNEQTLEMTPKVQIKEENNESAQRAFEKMNAGAFEAWRPKQRDTSLSAAKEWAEANGLSGLDDDGAKGHIPSGAGAGSLAALAARQGGAGGYVPPSMRNADGTRNEALAQRDDSCTVRVSNLSEDVKDSDLRELFRRFGAIQRIYLAKDRETHQSRGFAFINFFAREDAQRAIDKLDGHGYDHLILSVSWANPSGEQRPTGPPPDLHSGPPPGGGGESRRSVDSRFDKQVFDSGLDRFRT